MLSWICRQADPGVCRSCSSILSERRRKSDEIDVHVIQLVEIRVGRQLGIKHQLLRQPTGSLLPKFDESQDFIILLFLAQITVRVAKHPSLGILRYEGQHALLLAATL